MSHNRLGEINIFAFKGLKKLKILDLSYNAIQEIYPHWFEDLSKLEYLYLEGNHFGDMSKLQKHAFNSEKIKVKANQMINFFFNFIFVGVRFE